MSQRSDYQPHDPNKVLAPWSEEKNMVLDQWNYVPSPRDDFEEVFDKSLDSYDDWEDDCGTSCEFSSLLRNQQRYKAQA
ncbi:hypothetical protein L13192_05183 [Pyrenophora tritici-repentis]|nr:hypothetical protein L13192_05183 [Pyrenophora tritici-repentis]